MTRFKGGEREGRKEGGGQRDSQPGDRHYSMHCIWKNERVERSERVKRKRRKIPISDR